MNGIYTSYICKSCKREIVLLTDELESTLREGKYISCSHCGSKRLVKELVTDDLREVTKARSYKRVSGRIRQI
ncbi:MAG: hypothetical protein E6344_18250 [Clostridium sp.]|nr:hypothetical protein [Clostridium sp.]MDU7085640.1 hypothetical protein [Clostridium sp.]